MLQISATERMVPDTPLCNAPALLQMFSASKSPVVKQSEGWSPGGRCAGTGTAAPSGCCPTSAHLELAPGFAGGPGLASPRCARRASRLAGQINPRTSQLEQQAEPLNEAALEKLVLLPILAVLRRSACAGTLRRRETTTKRKQQCEDTVRESLCTFQPHLVSTAQSVPRAGRHPPAQAVGNLRR